MSKTPVFLLLSSLALTLPLAAQDAAGSPMQFRAGKALVVVRSDGLQIHARVSRDGGRSFRALQDPYHQVHLKYAAFDPLQGAPQVPASLQAGAGNELHIVHFHTQPLQEYREALLALGVEIHTYVPEDSYLLRMPANLVDAVSRLPFVRWVGPFHPAYKLPESLRTGLLQGMASGLAEYNVVLVDPEADRHTVLRLVEEAGGRVVHPMDTPGNLMVRVELDPEGLLAVAQSNRVAWIDESGPLEYDVNNARIVAGANYIESQGGFTGKGVRGYNTEGMLATHVEFQATAFRSAPIPLLGGGFSGHGTNVAGIVWARGANPTYRGFAPDAQVCYTSGSTVRANRAQAISTAVNPSLIYKAMHDTASHGNPRTTSYTSVSANTDSVYFTYDILHTQSQSNAGATSIPRNSRPEAWAKNVMGVGAVYHFNNTNPADDRWDGSSSSRASIGPAADGRVKPDICGWYDAIGTTSSSGGYTNSFGGTSGATPIVAGNVALAQELFTDGLFGHDLLPGGMSNRFANRAASTTAKALIINTARQYSFSGTAHRNSRDKQGWGFPSVQDLYDLRDKMLVIDESEVLPNGGQRSYVVWVPPGTAQFRSTMVYSDPPGAAFASITRINNLDLRVRDLGAGTTWWGNNQARTQMFTPAGGSANDRDTVENVLLRSPASGIYVVDVLASSVVRDAVPGVAGTNADFALVVSGLSGYRDRSGMTLDLQSSATGDIRATVSNVPASGWTEGYTFFTFDTARTEGFGYFFGIEADGITSSILTAPAQAGDLFHFTSGGSGSQYPNATFTVNPAIAAGLSGLTVDGIVVLFDASGNIVAMSNAKRLVIQ